MRLERIGSAAASEALRQAIRRHRGPPLALSLERRGLGPYRAYAEMLSALEELSRRGARLERLGDTTRGEPLFALGIGDAKAKRVTALISGLHPMEWIGVETHLSVLEALVESPPADRQIVSVVVANPDGIVRVGANLRAERRRFVRHNARRVDLNRNFPSFWGRPGLARLLLRPLFAGGRGPASEPEVSAICARFKDAMVDRAVSFHSFGGVVLHPYGAKWAEPLDVAELSAWARQVARGADPARPYRAVQSSRWVPGFTAPGMELDWFYDRHGALSLLIECSRGGLGLPRPTLSKLLEPFAWFNPEQPANVVRNITRAVLPFVRGEPLAE